MVGVATMAAARVLKHKDEIDFVLDLIEFADRLTNLLGVQFC